MKTQSNNISKAQVMKKAWAEFRAYNGNTMAFFANCLRDAWAFFKKQAVSGGADAAAYIQQLKGEVLNINSRRVMGSTFCQEGMAIVRAVANAGVGFASDVASTVLKFKKASEKQAYVIARAAAQIA